MGVIAHQTDEGFMDQALALAEQGRGQTSPNPMVGAIVVSPEGVVVGSGFHRRAGDAHAEVLALRDAGDRARAATLYCTLEPCSHHGRTGPCTEEIVAAGVHRVVVGMIDPDSRVQGRGVAFLRERGVQVEVGVRRQAAARLNEWFITWVTHGRPFVTMKIATSRDGMIAAQPGERTQLTSAAAATELHHMRSIVDAIGVGSTTVLVDDPLLTARGVERTRPLTRVVFDRRLRTPVTARLLQTLDAGPVIIMTKSDAVSANLGAAERLREKGVIVECLAGDGDMAAALRRLGQRELISMIIEGGTTVHRAAWDAGVVDLVQRFVAPVEIGPRGVPWLDLSMDALCDRRMRSFGPDVLMEGYVQRVD